MSIHTPLSANTLFHFTSNMDNLLGILREGFYPRYCLEDQSHIGIENEVAIPMVCFCDIQLSQIRNHVEYYGKYALGLSKEWGIRNRISPIMYTIPNAISTEMIKSNLNIIPNYSPNDMSNMINNASFIDNKNPLNLLVQVISRQYAFLSFLKAYEGRFWKNKNYLEEEVRFYDEREWRFVPVFEDMIRHDVPHYLEKDKFLNVQYRNNANKLVNLFFNIPFKPNDIKYIIIENESEILDIMDKISDIKGKFSTNEVNILKTRIITMEQILNDF